jgi:RimJ/RimL family protein N-acetyltransferase
MIVHREPPAAQAAGAGLGAGQESPLPIAPVVAPLGGRYVRLRPVVPDDYEYLYALASDERLNLRWRHRGESLNPETFVQTLWHQVLVQFIIEENRQEDAQSIGHVLAYGPDLRNRHAAVAMVLEPDYFRRGWTLEAMVLLLNYVFTAWEMRKLYMEVIDYNLPQFGSGLDRYFAEEACLKQHEYAFGRYWDIHILAIYREAFFQHAKRVLAWSTRPAAPRPTIDMGD